MTINKVKRKQNLTDIKMNTLIYVRILKQI